MFAGSFYKYLVLVERSFNCQLANRVGPKYKHTPLIKQNSVRSDFLVGLTVNYLEHFALKTRLGLNLEGIWCSKILLL